VFVPCDFLAAEEAHRFILPGADVRSYEDGQNFTPAQLSKHYRFFAAYVPLGEEPRCDGCRVLDTRLAVRGRHTSHAVGHASLNDLLKQLLVREVLFESAAAPRETPPFVEACAG
jgi:hypothetical protein